MKKIFLFIFLCLSFSYVKMNEYEDKEIEYIINNLKDLFENLEVYKEYLFSSFSKEVNLQFTNNTFVSTFLPLFPLAMRLFIHNENIENISYQMDQNFIETIEKKLKADQEVLHFFLLKLIMDSSKNKNDVSTYRECSEKYYSYNQTNIYKNRAGYFLITIDKRKNVIEDYYNCLNDPDCERCLKKSNETDCENYYVQSNFPSFKIDTLTYTFGLCLPVIECDCDLIKNLEALIARIIFNLNNAMDLHSDKDNEIKITLVNNTGLNKEITKISKEDIYFNFIPLYISLIIFLFMCLNTLPKCLFQSCFKKKKIERTISNINNSDLRDSSSASYIFDKKKFLNFSKKFFIRANWEELFNYKNPTEKINNYSGLSYITGIRGFSMLFLSFGFLFLNLLNSPIGISREADFGNLLSHFLYPIFFFGLRYCPKILLSCSGYILFYKFICFLDEKNDEQIQQKIDEYNKNVLLEDKKAKIEINLENDLNDSEYEEDNNDNIQEKQKEKEKEEEINLRKRNVEDVYFSSLFQFYFYQIHKYLFFILVLFFCRYTLPYFYKIEALFYFGELKGIFLSPMYTLFQSNYINVIDIKKFIMGLTSTYPFHYQGDNPENLLYFFWLFYNEVIFFIISTFIIFIGYKFQIRIDSLLKFLIVVIYITKIVLYKVVKIFRNASLYYYYNNFGSIFVNPLYNYSYYLIGIYFGSINYVLQKRLTFSDAENQNKPFLLSFVPIVNWYQQKGWFMKILNLVLFIFVVGINFLNFFYSLFLFGIEKNEFVDKFETIIFGDFNNIILSFDTEVIVFFYHTSAFLFFIDNDNFINAFFSHNFWTIFNKLYVIFIILINPVILFILFQSGMRIKLNIYNCILYTLIADFSVFILSLLCYIFFELPSKRIIKLIFNKSDKEKKIQ